MGDDNENNVEQAGLTLIVQLYPGEAVQGAVTDTRQLAGRW
jgi:hypothetical protein